MPVLTKRKNYTDYRGYKRTKYVDKTLPELIQDAKNRAAKRRAAAARRPRKYVKKRAPRFEIGPYAGRFKKRTSKKKVRKPTQGNRDSIYGTIMGNEAAYSGWSTSGGRAYAIKQFCEHLFRQVCAERKVDIRGRDEPLGWSRQSTTRMGFLRLLHRHVRGDGTVGDAYYDVDLIQDATSPYTAKSFDQVVTAMETAVSDILRYEGRYIYGYELHPHGAEIVNVVRLQVDTWKYTYKVNISYKIQNITPADDANGTKDDTQHYSKDSIMANPLSGRSYEFSPGYPRIRPAALESNSSLAVVSNENWDHGLVQFPAQADQIYDPGHPLHNPPPGGTIFQNCKKGASMSLNPGSFKTLHSSFTFSGTIRQWCQKVQSAQGTDAHNSQYTRFTLGNTVAFGLKPTMRTTTSEQVKLAYQLDIVSSGYMKPKYKCTIPRSNNTSNYPIGTENTGTSS